MYNPYGQSGYKPANHNKPTRTDRTKPAGQSARAHKPKSQSRQKTEKLFKRIAIWAGIAAAAAFFIVWLCLGDFRFMMWRYAGLSGFPFGDRNYVVLFQNNYELRPTGGFISTYGELTFQSGIFTGIEFHDVYGDIDDHEYIEPPLVLSALLEDENYIGHTFRDANYDPDFTLAKDDIIEFYQITNPDKDVDGIIAADFTFLEWMVERYEPLWVEGYELTSENLFETLSTVVSDIDRHNEEALAERKNITSPIVKKIISKTIILPWRIFGMLDLLEQGFEEKHVLAAFNRSGLAKSFAKRNWDGALPQSDAGDFIAINDANYGGMKSNRYITRDVQYELEITDATDVLGNPVVNAEVSVTLSHEGTWNTPLSGPYTGYLRVMVPLGADITSGSSITETRDDSEVLAEMIELDPGESATYTYSYELPEYIWVNGDYNLHLHKQPGTLNDHYRIIVRVPQGMTLDGKDLDVRENVAFYETNLATDENLVFSLVSDENPPHIVLHELTDLNEITIVFNEPLATDYAGDALNYTITDTDHSNETVTDTVTINSIRVDGNTVILTTSGITAQSDERYEVTLRGIKDTNGNTIDPNPRTVTVIQDEFEETAESESIDTSTSQDSSTDDPLYEQQEMTPIYEVLDDGTFTEETSSEADGPITD
jgi:hypothetical protein